MLLSQSRFRSIRPDSEDLPPFRCTTQPRRLTRCADASTSWHSSEPSSWEPLSGLFLDNEPSILYWPQPRRWTCRFTFTPGVPESPVSTAYYAGNWPVAVQFLFSARLWLARRDRHPCSAAHLLRTVGSPPPVETVSRSLGFIRRRNRRRANHPLRGLPLRRPRQRLRLPRARRPHRRRGSCDRTSQRRNRDADLVATACAN